ncbi:amidohydrolase family protein [Nocardiopsis lambiniae]|uniref:Amidohydrolase family protein n=1 Tax=Nocardiopsis lambiniae TaxID=3075539 RepID=A0ABU2MF05_9ACTN|nr:amidohydrolase family protein [Nocardiopsis sp. DSM 44743]MDT0331149.1 amidohydrolase family protein [Nocardiopsis sp. DSM 44743]
MAVGTLALTRVGTLVGDTLTPVEGTVVITDGRITAVGPDAAVPGGARVRPLPGHTVLPGLVDTHVHLGAPEARGPLSRVRAIAGWFRFQPGKRRSFLAHGVTTVCSLGDENAWVHDFRRRVADGTLSGPRVRIAGPLFTAPGGHPVATIGASPDDDWVRVPGSPDQARAQVADLAGGEDPVDVIKVVQDRGDPARRVLEPIAPPVLAAIVEEAHRHGVPVVAHWGTLPDLAELLEAGVDHLQHLEPRGPLRGWPADLLETMVTRGVTLAPTLAVTEPRLDADTARALRHRVREFHEAGGVLLAGSDAGTPAVRSGAGLIREIALLAACGLTPREALIAATTAPARALGIDGAGAIAPGRAADLTVVHGDPLTDLDPLHRVALVLRDGRVVVDTARRR